MRGLGLLVVMVLSASGVAYAQTTTDPATAQTTTAVNEGRVTFGVLAYLQYDVELHEQDGYNAFEVTRGYFDVKARLSDRIRVRFTTNVRPTTDATLEQNLTARLEYAYLDAAVTDRTSILFGMQETPWLTFEESVNRYRVQGQMFTEREGLIPGPSDLGAAAVYKTRRLEAHLGVYNGEGYGRAEIDKYKSVQGRGTGTLYSSESGQSKVRLSGFYSYGWYAKDRPRNIGIVMASYDSARRRPRSISPQPTIHSCMTWSARACLFWRGAWVTDGPTGRVDIFNPDASEGRRRPAPLHRRRCTEPAANDVWICGNARAGVSRQQRTEDGAACSDEWNLDRQTRLAKLLT